VQRNVQVGPEDLGDRRLGAEFTACGEPGDGAERVQPVRLRLDPGVGHPVSEHRVGSRFPLFDEPLGGCEEACGAAQ
jgi:hypothetical protein